MARIRAALILLAAAAVGLALVSGGSGADPRTPPGLPGLPPPFLGTTVSGDGELTAAVDAYGDVVDLRPSPAGRALIENPSDRQAAGTVAADTGIVPRLEVGSETRSPWEADEVRQRYLPGTNVVVTELRFGGVDERVTTAALGGALVVVVRMLAAGGGVGPERGGVGAEGRRAESGDKRGAPTLSVNLVEGSGLDCRRAADVSTATLLCTVAAEAGSDGASQPGDSDSGGARSGADRAGSASRGNAGPPARTASALIRRAVAADRTWLGLARPLGPDAPAWARQMYERSLLTLRALTNSRTGAVAAGARDGWAYVWPRDAGAAALAFAAAGYPGEARRVARFLGRLDLRAAARFDAGGQPIPGRAAQGDAEGWAEVASAAARLPVDKSKEPSAAPTSAGGPGETNDPAPPTGFPWRHRADYQEGTPGDYLANAIASTAASPSHVDGPQIQGGQGSEARQPEPAGWAAGFWDGRGLVRRAGDPGSGLDSAAAWAVRPFAIPALFPAARVTMLRLARRQTRFGITPGEAWPGVDPWSAPTAWTAWSLAALSREVAITRARGGQMQPRRAGPTAAALQAAADRRQALRLLGDLRRAATPAGALPERVDVDTGIPRSTTPLAWSHAFAILALRELWPAAPGGSPTAH